MTSVRHKILGLIASAVTLLSGAFVFVFLYAGTTLGSDSGNNDTIRVLIGWLNIIGTPILSLTVATYVLKKTWGKKFALWGAITALLVLVAVFVTYVWPRFF